jgi:hypothetical protein
MSHLNYDTLGFVEVCILFVQMFQCKHKRGINPHKLFRDPLTNLTIIRHFFIKAGEKLRLFHSKWTRRSSVSLRLCPLVKYMLNVYNFVAHTNLDVTNNYSGCLKLCPPYRYLEFLALLKHEVHLHKR